MSTIRPVENLCVSLAGSSAVGFRGFLVGFLVWESSLESLFWVLVPESYQWLRKYTFDLSNNYGDGRTTVLHYLTIIP